MKRTEDSWEKRWIQSDFSLHWTAEMFAYMFSAARLGIRHMISDILQDQPSYHKVRLAPVIHYSLSFKLSNGVSWGKGMPDADGEPLTQLLKASLPVDTDEVITGARAPWHAVLLPLVIFPSVRPLSSGIPRLCLVASVRHSMGECVQMASRRPVGNALVGIQLLRCCAR